MRNTCVSGSARFAEDLKQNDTRVDEEVSFNEKKVKKNVSFFSMKILFHLPAESYVCNC